MKQYWNEMMTALNNAMGHPMVSFVCGMISFCFFIAVVIFCAIVYGR
jgi:hypothetical protein